MLRFVVVITCLLPVSALAQSAHEHHAATKPSGASNVTMSKSPEQPGQSAFAAIQEIVAILESDPQTDWSKVDIEGLRMHLIDMDNVTMRARVTSVPVDNGMRFEVAGVGDAKESIRRMLFAHAATMTRIGEWKFTAISTDTGAELVVVVPAHDRLKLKGLGFIGVMTRGMHHQSHHMMIARGDNPHQ
ncbi:MAG: hypothetical protein K2P80_03420 [Beijerinckiaceae bacterium]|nr:hypothetical protein [Beijerinckiaceae bacterium]